MCIEEKSDLLNEARRLLLVDPISRLMRSSGDRVGQCYNQAMVCLDRLELSLRDDQQEEDDKAEALVEQICGHQKESRRKT